MLEDLFQAPTSVSLLVVVVLLVLQFLYSSFSSKEKRREPPGPKPLPVIGNLFHLLNRRDIALLNLSKTYGSVFTVYLGLKKVVILAGYKTVKQALVCNAEEFGERDVPRIFHDLNQGYGIGFTNGRTWKEMRRFALSTLRDFGMGKSLTEEGIIEECHHLIKSFEQTEGKAFNNFQLMTCATSNIISVVVFGRRFEYTDPVFQAMVDRNRQNLFLLGSASSMIYNMFPWLGPFIKNRRNIMENAQKNKSEVRHILSELKQSLNPETRRCFIDAFLIQKLKLEESGIKDSLYNDENLVQSVMGLFAGGTDPTANVISWSLLFMAKYPHVQDRVQEELSRVIGSRQVRVEDRKHLPYTDAVIHESQRFSNISPMTPPHRTSQDVTFQGYFIKKGTPVIPLLTSVMYDESEWESPHTFNPSHFLDKEGKFIRRDAFLPFSAGRRSCPGESLARMELFLFFTSLLQRFRFTPPPGVTEDELDLTPVVGLALYPLPHELCAVNRHCAVNP